MPPWLIVVIVVIGLITVPSVIAGLFTRRWGGSFWDGVMIVSGVVIGANQMERIMHIEPRCPWPGCNYDLQPHRWRHPFSCPACGQPIRWMQGGRVPVRVELEERR